MKIRSIPFDGLFTAYSRTETGEMRKVFHGFEPADIPEALKDAEVVRLYPFNDSIIVEIKEA